MRAAGFVAYAAFGFALMPAWAVKSAPTEERIGWAVCWLILSFASLMATVIVRSSGSTLPKPGQFELRYRFYLAGAVGITFLVATLVAVAVTYAQPGVGLVGDLELLISNLGSLVFPVVAKYATAMQPPLPVETLFKVQAIVSIFLLAGAATACAWVAYFFTMPEIKRKQMHLRSRQRKPSAALIFAGVPFGLLMASMAFFGWSEFASITRKGCLIHAVCYAHGSDLMIMIAAGGKALVVFGFPLGCLGLVDSYLKQPES
jgi:hypothetical protein